MYLLIIAIDMTLQALTALCERTEHDVRSCLNTLQFLSKRTKAIRSLHVSGVQCAQKDMVKSAFGVWQDLFKDKASPFMAIHSII